MTPSVVADAGGILVFSGALEGQAPAGVEVLALDWATVTVGRLLALRHEGHEPRWRREVGLAIASVDEWFPVRTLVADALQRAGLAAIDALDSWSAVVLAEQLDVPLLTASDEVSSTSIEIYRPW